VVRHSQFRFPAIENERHYQIFLVVEMPGKPLQQGRTRAGIIVAAPLQPFTAGLQSPQKRIRGFRGARHIAMNVMVVAFEDVEAKRKSRVSAFEDREVVEIFDLMMEIKLVQQEL
jgi:hypothetical protein